MLRKLITAVLVFSLIMAFTGTAFAGEDTPTAQLKLRPAPALKLDQELMTRAANANTLSKVRTVTQMGMDVPYPSALSPDHECEILDYSDYNGSFYSIPWYGDDPTTMASLFDVQDLHNGVLYGAAVRIYEASNIAGGCDLVFNVYDADGTPGNLLYTETIPAAQVQAAAPGNLLFTFATPVDITTPEFIIQFGTGGTGPVDDYIVFGLNDGAAGDDNGRGFYEEAGVWYALGDAFGQPMNVRLAADICYTDFTDCYYTETGLQYIITIPTDFGLTDGIWNGWGQQFTAANDTLKSVNVVLYIHHDAVPRYAGTNETNGLIVEVWGDDGGNIDLASGPLATRTIPGGVANLFPVTGDIRANGAIERLNVDFSADNLVFRGDYHVTAKLTSTDPADGQVTVLLFDFGEGGSLRYDALDWESTYSNNSWLTEFWGNGNSFAFGVEMCRDEFQACENQILHAGDFASAWTMDDCGNIAKTAQKVKGSEIGNRPEILHIQVADDTPWGFAPEDNGDPGLRVTIYGDAGGEPGAVLWTTDIDPVDLVVWPGWNDVVIPESDNLLIFGDFYVGYEAIVDPATVDCAVDIPADWINSCMDMGPFDINGGAMVYYRPHGAWYSYAAFGIESNNFMIEVDFCSVPVPERPCVGGDWSTLQGDFARTGAANMGIGNAQCDLTKNWEYEHPTLISQYVGPVIYDGLLISTFRSGTAGSEIVVFDLETKAQLYTIPLPGDVRGIPTVAHNPYLGIDMIYTTGGDETNVASGWALADGSNVWTIASGDLPGMGATEINPTGNIIIIGDVLYFTTSVGKVFAVWADDGSQLGGIWPVDYYQIGSPGPTASRTGCTDGENLYYAYSTIFGGDVVSVNASDGSENWLLTTDGLKGFDAWGAGITVEQFAGGISYDDGYVYVQSTCASDVHPIASVLYKINSVSGVTEAFAQANTTSWAVHPVIDMDYIYAGHAPVGSYWINEVNVADVQAFDKETCEYSWGVIFGEDNSIDHASAEMLLTCEPDGAADLLFLMTSNGYLRCINTETHQQLFRRRITDADFGGAAGAIGLDNAGTAHLVYQTVLGRMIDLTAQVDRPRLEVLNPWIHAPVPFGTDNPYSVVFSEVFTNTGCTDLDVSLTISETSNGSPAPIYSVSQELADATNEIADKLTIKGSPLADFNNDLDARPALDRQPVNNAALADMSWILTPTLNYTLTPDEVSDITVDVIQADVGRGIFHFWAEFTTTNDPDYWLDVVDSPVAPEVKLTFLGGCLVENTELTFGDGNLNTQPVFNTGRLAIGGELTFHYEGASGVFYQGALIMGAGEHRISLSTHNWLGGDESDAYVSWMGEQYMGECVPILENDVQFGAYTEDGITYTPIMGNVVRNNSIDSIQNFDDGAGGWDWNDVTAPYDNALTMGLAIHHKTIGAYDFGASVDLIGNATVEILQVTERNGAALPGWYLGNYIDYDIGGTDTAWGDFDISAGFCYGKDQSGLRDLMGMIKIPFGCGETPLLNVWSVDQDSGMWTGVPFLEECYNIMSSPQGNYAKGPSTPAPDMAASFTLASNDFAGGDTYTTAVAYYWVQDYPTAHEEVARMANQLNKWMGFGRGDVNNDDMINLVDIIYLANHVGYGGAGPIPFSHLGDVNASGAIDGADVTYLVDYYFSGGACPMGDFLYAD